MRSRLLTLLATTVALLLVPVAGAAAATFTVTTTEDSGAGSLRQAITEANGTPGSTIDFNILGTGPFTIAPATVLPNLNAAGTTIDACSQPEADCSGLPLTLQVQLAGRGISVHANGVTIKGLSITGVPAGGPTAAAILVGSLQGGGTPLSPKI
ncbi:MAG TPA: hypothetical protein VGH14_05425 [Solirubrobacterales bacterium]|jgi:hypothetical protein